MGPDGSMTLGGHLKELRNRVVFVRSCTLWPSWVFWRSPTSSSMF